MLRPSPHGRTALGIFLGTALCATALGLPETPSPSTPPKLSSVELPSAIDLLDNSALSTRLASLGAVHSATAETFTIGTARSGASIEGVKLSNGQDTIGKPAILVVGNIDAGRVFSATIAMSVAERVAADFASKGEGNLLEHATVYVIPRLNVDGASARFASPLFDDGATGYGVDNDRDGLMGEDGPADVNGDGQITWMRVPDPEGTWIEDPFDTRANVEADSTRGERGEWKIMREGLDSDGDDSIAEDAANDARVSRNFPAGFEEHTAAAGHYGGSEPEVRAMMDFVIGHPELTVVVTFDGTDNLISEPASADDPTPSGRFFRGPRTLPDGKVLKSDADLLKEFGRRAKDIREDGAKADAYPKGSFQRWIYEHRGLMTLDFAAWQMPTETESEKEKTEGDQPENTSSAAKATSDDSDVATWDVQDSADDTKTATDAPGADTSEDPEKPDTWRKASDDAGRLRWLDNSGLDSRFIAWQDFAHPQLGAIQVGGWAPFALTEPPSSERQAISDAAADFVLGLGGTLAQVEIASFTATKLSKRLWRIEAAIENNSLLPLMSKAGARARTVRPARLELVLPASSSIVAGEGKQLIPSLDGSGGRSEFTWLIDIKNPKQLGLNITTDHAGTTSQACTLEEK